MIRALHSSAAGMQSQQMSLDVIANNLANVQTTGFKKSKIEFQDLLYQSTRPRHKDGVTDTTSMNAKQPLLSKVKIACNALV